MALQREVCLVTDSTADIPPSLAEELGIVVVPLNVTIEGETFLDGSIPMSEFYRRMAAAANLPTTSQPAVGAWIDAFRSALDRYAQVICVTVSSKLSGTHESAAAAVQQIGERIHLFDSLSLSWGEGYQVVRAARAALAGAAVDEVKRTLEQARSAMNMIVGVNSLENLAKGGRVSKTVAVLGGILNVKVLLTIGGDGSLAPQHRTRGTTAALEATVDWLAKRIDPGRPVDVGVLHAELPDAAAWLEERVRERFAVRELLTIETGPVIGTHAGTAWGLAAAQTD